LAQGPGDRWRGFGDFISQGVNNLNLRYNGIDRQRLIDANFLSRSHSETDDPPSLESRERKLDGIVPRLDAQESVDTRLVSAYLPRGASREVSQGDLCSDHHGIRGIGHSSQYGAAGQLRVCQW
jgi:hypothetical protein